MRKLILFLISIPLSAQISPPSQQSRVAGRFVASNYGQWTLQVTSPPSGTGVKQLTVSTSTVKLSDGRLIMPFNTNSPIIIGIETVTPSVVGSGCYLNGPTNSCILTVTVTQSHGQGDRIVSATFGLQEALNDAGSSGGGAVTVDSAWAALGGTTGIINAATLPSNTNIEDVRTGVSSSYVLPKATTLVLGGVKPDGITCTTDGNGVLTCPGSGTGYVFVQSLTVSSPVPALTFSAIPQTARDLQLTCTGSESGANDVSNQVMTTNSDSSNHYYWVLSTNYDGTPGGATSSALTSGAVVGVFNGTSTTGVGTFTVNIPNYTNATFANHQFTGTATVKRTSQSYTFQTSGFWNQTAAITRIDVADAGTANFTSGTTCVLRGLP